MDQAPDFIPAPKPASGSDPDFIPAGASAPPPAPAAPPPPGLLDPHPTDGIGSQVGEFLRGGAAGIYNTVRHPLAILDQLRDILPAYTMVNGMPVPIPNREGAQHALEMGQQAIAHPAYTAGSIAVPVAAGEAVGRIIPPMARGGMEMLTKSGAPKTAEFVDTTRAANDTAIGKAADANAANAAKRAGVVQKVGQERIATQAANDSAAARQTRKFALEKGVEHLDPKLKEDLAATEAKTKVEANRRYNEINSQLDEENAHPDLLPELLIKSSEAMKGSNTETPIMHDMEKKLKAGEPLTYRDLQGYRSEIGRELSRGNLPGDVYQAYKRMLESIDEGMQGIADKRGLGNQLTDARSYYKQYADTFLDPSSPTRKALDSVERGGVVKAFAGKDQSGIEAIAKYDPELAQRINTTRGYAKEAKGTRAAAAAPKPLPTLPPNTTPPVVPEITKLGPEDITKMKRDAITARGQKLQDSSGHVANAFAAYDIIRNLMHGNLEGVGVDIAARAGYGGAKMALAKALQNPTVVEFLSRPTAKDLAELNRLPAEQRTANVQPLIEAAKSKGVPISPAIIAAVSGAANVSGLPQKHQLNQPPQ